MSRIRWFILILGPLPIVGSSWALSAWFKSEPRAVAERNDAIVDVLADASSPAERGRPRAAAIAPEELHRACQQAADRLKQQTPADFQVIARPPFVVGGDLPRSALEAWHAEKILPAVRAMQCRYFRSRPDQPITVLLFKGEESYNRYSQKLFGDSGISIYGYYKPTVRTLLANVATGDGTLLHELTHALLDFEIPDAPVWLNEGLASLHEQCRFRSDEQGPWIEGLVNWRLSGLQQVVRQGRLRPLESLLEERDFRGPLVGVNYAQARYFCLYMQREGVLETFFHDYRDHRAGDPRGQAAVARAFGSERRAQLDRDFERFVLELSD